MLVFSCQTQTQSSRPRSCLPRGVVHSCSSSVSFGQTPLPRYPPLSLYLLPLAHSHPTPPRQPHHPLRLDLRLRHLRGSLFAPWWFRSPHPHCRSLQPCPPVLWWPAFSWARGPVSAVVGDHTTHVKETQRDEVYAKQLLRTRAAIDLNMRCQQIDGQHPNI